MKSLSSGRRLLIASACGFVLSPALVHAQGTDPINPVDRRLTPGDGIFENRGPNDLDSQVGEEGGSPTLYEDSFGRRYYQDNRGTRYYAEQPRQLGRGLQGRDLTREFDMARTRIENELRRMSGLAGDGPRLGVGISNAQNGVQVDAVTVGSVAEKAGFEPGDIIESVNGKQISDVRELQQMIGSDVAGEEVKFTVRRDDEQQTLTATFPQQSERQSVAKPAMEDSSQIQQLKQQIEQLRQDVAALKQEVGISDNAAQRSQSGQQQDSQRNQQQDSQRNQQQDSQQNQRDSQSQDGSSDQSGSDSQN